MLSGTEVDAIFSPSSPFRVIFDPHKAQPHYLIVWKDEETNKAYIDVMEITAGDQIRLITCAKEVTQAMGLQELSILSLHQGLFSNPKHASSVHLLVKPDNYLEEFRKLDPDQSCYDEIARKVDKWFDISIEKNNVWKDQDLASLHFYVQQKKGKIKPAKYDHLLDFCEIIFHSTQPRIGFKLKDSDQHEEILMRLLIQFVEDQRISGSHICICLSKSLAVYDEEFGSAQIRAYLQVHIKDYFRVNPNRHEWLEKFENPDVEYAQYT